MKQTQSDCNTCVCFSLRKASRVITQFYDDILRPLGFRVTQLNILLAVLKLEPVTLTYLAHVTLTDRTTLARNFKPLEKQGLIFIQLGQDRREREIVLTTKGHKVVQKVLPLWDQAQSKIIKAVGKEKLGPWLKELDVILEKIRQI